MTTLKREEETDSTKWKQMTQVLMTAAKEVCGEEIKSVLNPWMVGKDEQVQRMRSRISGAISRRNNIRKRINEEQLNLENELEMATNDLKEGRKELQRERRKMVGGDYICKEASDRGDSRTKFKALQQLGKRDWKGSSNNTTITTDQFREHFSREV